MADERDFSMITIRHKTSGQTRDVAKHTLDDGFWPDYERVDSQGRAIRSASSEKKES